MSSATTINDVDHMAALVRKIATRGAMPGEGAGRAIARVARRLGLSYRQSARLWNRDRKVIPNDLMKRAELLAGEPSVREAKNELSEMDARIARLEALLVSDEDFFGAHLDAERTVVRHMGRAVDRDDA